MSVRFEAKSRGLIARRTVLACAIAGVVLPAILFPVLSARGAGTRTVDIVIKNGKVAGKNSVRVSRGDTVVLRWSSNQRLELHLHGYDVETTVSPEAPAEMVIRARSTGRFPVEIHGHGDSGSGHGHKAIFYLEVYPD